MDNTCTCNPFQLEAVPQALEEQPILQTQWSAFAMWSSMALWGLSEVAGLKLLDALAGNPPGDPGKTEPIVPCIKPETGTKEKGNQDHSLPVLFVVHQHCNKQFLCVACSVLCSKMWNLTAVTYHSTTNSSHQFFIFPVVWTPHWCYFFLSLVQSSLLNIHMDAESHGWKAEI